MPDQILDKIKNDFKDRLHLHELLRNDLNLHLDIVRAYLLMNETIRCGHKFVMFGNGGSATDAQQN